MKQFVRVFVDQRCELRGGRETVQDSNASAARRAQSAAKVVDGFERNAVAEDRVPERSRLGAGIPTGLAGLRERLAVGLVDVLSRDSAAWRADQRTYTA